jgi:hypothetical protein
MHKRFFFEKKKQKTFAVLGSPWGQHIPKMTKVFWFFSSEKNILTSWAKRR